MYDTTFDPHAGKKRSVEEDILNNVLNEDSSKINHAYFSSLVNAAHFYDRIILKYLVFFP
jgi:hypothetical protein